MESGIDQSRWLSRRAKLDHRLFVTSYLVSDDAVERGGDRMTSGIMGEESGDLSVMTGDGRALLEGISPIPPTRQVPAETLEELQQLQRFCGTALRAANESQEEMKRLRRQVR